jgi:hypothetical protein
MPSANDEHPTQPASVQQRPPPLGALEAVVALDAHHRHPLPFGGELVDRGGDGLLALGHGRQSRVPLGLADDRRMGEGHCLVLS